MTQCSSLVHIHIRHDMANHFMANAKILRKYIFLQIIFASYSRTISLRPVSSRWTRVTLYRPLRSTSSFPRTRSHIRLKPAHYEIRLSRVILAPGELALSLVHSHAVQKLDVGLVALLCGWL